MSNVSYPWARKLIAQSAWPDNLYSCLMQHNNAFVLRLTIKDALTLHLWSKIKSRITDGRYHLRFVTSVKRQVLVCELSILHVQLLVYDHILRKTKELSVYVCVCVFVCVCCVCVCVLCVCVCCVCVCCVCGVCLVCVCFVGCVCVWCVCVVHTTAQ
jgi:hypothetical protein